MSEGNSADSLLSFLLGAAVGAVAALLLAPSSGKETRNKLAEWLEQNREKTQEFLDKSRERIHRHT